MSYPVHNTGVVALGLSRLTGAFTGMPNIRAWLTVCLQPWQDLEDATFAVLAARDLASVTLYTLPQTNFILDILGAMVGQPSRDGLNDADYRSIIYLRIAVDRSTGRVTDWSNYGSILLRTCPGPVQYFDYQGSVYFGVWDMELNPNIVASILAQGIDTGVGGTFAYSTWPDGSDFECSSVYAPTVGELGFGSVYTSSVGGQLVAGAQI